jgi:hypothetical protein
MLAIRPVVPYRANAFENAASLYFAVEFCAASGSVLSKFASAP